MSGARSPIGPTGGAERHSGDVLARAEAIYEAGRKRVSGRPPWAMLDPADPYDMGMRDVAIRQAEAGISSDPVHDAEVIFLLALSEGRRPAAINAGLDWQKMARDERNAAREHGRVHNAARQRAKQQARAVWSGRAWFITSTGRAWLAALPTPLATTEAGR